MPLIRQRCARCEHVHPSNDAAGTPCQACGCKVRYADYTPLLALVMLLAVLALLVLVWPILMNPGGNR